MPALPILQGPQNYGAIRADGVNDQQVAPSPGAHRVLRYTIPAGAGIASLTKVVVRYGGAREGGGIYCYRSAGVLIASCHIHRNIAFWNISPNLAGVHLPDPFTGTGWFEEAMGGGIGLYRAPAIIWGNLIERNLALYGAAIGLAFWLMAVAAGPDFYQPVSALLGSPIGQTALYLIVAALAYHFANGIRHLVFDTGAGLAPSDADTSAWFAILFAIAAPIGLWALLTFGA